MRIALLYSGLPRQWQHCVPTHRPLFEDARVDVFCHFWETIAAPEKAALTAALNPTVCYFETPPDLTFVDDIKGLQRDAINIPSRMVAQYTSWLRTAALFAPYAVGYDVAIRLRTDLFFHQPLAIDRAAIRQRRLGLVACQSREDPGRIFDAFAIGRPSLLLHFLALLNRLWDYAQTDLFNPEALITRHISAYPGPATVELLADMPFYIHRPHMAGWPLAQCLAQAPGATKWHDPEIHQAHLSYFERRRGPAGVEYVNGFRNRQLADGS